MPVIVNSFKKQTISGKSTQTYSDLHLDIVEDKSATNTALRDIKADYDLAAIKNSLRNLFNTTPGQKLLNPAYGLSLMQFLFEPVSQSISTLIGDRILKGLNQYEPRVIVERIYVNGIPDDNSYIITLIISIPSLNILQINIDAQLNNTGFSVA